MQQKTFYKMILEINLYPEKIKQCLLDKRLTSIEKKILESYLLIRNNKNSEATKLLKSLPKSELPFVEALKYLVIGISQLNQSDFMAAEESIHQTLSTFKKLNSHYCLFIGHFNLCFIYLNTGQLPKAYETIKVMEKIPKETDLQEIRLLRSKFNYYCDASEEAKAEEILENINSFKSKMSENDIISHLISEFMFYVQKEDFNKCSQTLLAMKQYRKFHLTANYNYMKKLLDHLMKGTPVYAYEEDFASIPSLYQQIKVIQCLEENKLDMAMTFWDKLRASSPQMFKDNFKYEGTKTLFSLCLKKHEQVFKTPTQFTFNKEASKFDKFVTILKEANGPVAAGLLFELIWEKTAETKEDMLKVSRLAYRAKNEEGMHIAFRKGTYELLSIKSPKKKVS